MRQDPAQHIDFMRLAIGCATDAVAHGNHPFGAVLVHENKVLLTAENTVITGADLSHHAELNLLRAAQEQLPLDVLAHATLYASTEPCPMCTGAIFWAGVRRVVFGCPAPTLTAITGQGFHLSCRDIFEAATARVEVVGPVLADEATRIHRTFWAQENFGSTPGACAAMPLPTA